MSTSKRAFLHNGLEVDRLQGWACGGSGQLGAQGLFCRGVGVFLFCSNRGRSADEAVVRHQCAVCLAYSVLSIDVHGASGVQRTTSIVTFPYSGRARRRIMSDRPVACNEVWLRLDLPLTDRSKGIEWHRKRVGSTSSHVLHTFFDLRSRPQP